MAMRLFIFDMGEVILTDVRTLERVAEALGIDEEALKADYLIYDMALMDGYMSVESYYDHLSHKFLLPRIDGDPFARYFSPAVNWTMLGYVDALRKRGHRCVIGSNTFKPHWDIILGYDGRPADHFDALYASHLIHLSKPEEAFFRHIASQEGFDYEDVSFIDDRRVNTDSASRLGIETLLYAGPDKDAKAAAFFARYLS